MTIDAAGAVGRMLGALQMQGTTLGARATRSRDAGRAPSTSTQTHRARLEQDIKRLADAAAADSTLSEDASRVQLVRVLLQHELGGGIREHPEFGDIADRIAAELAADPALDARFLSLIGRAK